MRGKDFTNPDIRNIVTKSGGDIAEGKRAATSVARAAEMVADTKIKQEILADLDEMKLERGPRWWKGDPDSVYRGPMGKDSFGDMTSRLNDRIYYSVMDDLDALVGEEKSYEILKFVNKKNYPNDPDGFVQALKEEIESSAIKYDMTFWENYVDEIMQLTTADIPVFSRGGLV